MINNAEVLIGHQRHLAIFPDFPGEKRVLEDLSIMLDYLKTKDDTRYRGLIEKLGIRK